MEEDRRDSKAKQNKIKKKIIIVKKRLQACFKNSPEFLPIPSHGKRDPREGTPLHTPTLNSTELLYPGRPWSIKCVNKILLLIHYWEGEERERRSPEGPRKLMLLLTFVGT